MPYLDLPDCKLHYKVDDHTDPWTTPDSVLFVHGFTESTEAWRGWVPHFSRRYRMIRIDQRGFGLSTPMPKDYPLTTQRYVDDLAQVIRQVAGGKAHVVGGKSGGISVMMLAALRPDLVKTISVSCSPVTPPNAAGWIEEMERTSVRAWAKRNPARVQEMLDVNPAVVFFRADKLSDPTLGPNGAYGLPLTPKRSIAVDAHFVPLGTPVFLATTEPGSGLPMSRLVLAQDTGTAIQGAARADFYWGTGDEAGQQAGRMKQRGEMWLLWPKQAGEPSAR